MFGQQPATEPTESGFVPPVLPAPDLEVLEPSVAEQLAEAERWIRDLVEQPGTSDPALAASYGELGRIYHAYSLYEPAGICYSTAMALAPRDPRWPHHLGAVEQAEGRLNEAATAYIRAVELEPGNGAALVHLAEIRLLQNRIDDAQSFLEQARAQRGETAAVLAALGQVALSRRDYEEAINYLESALSQVGDANRLHYPLAMAYRGAGRVDEARRHLERQGTVGVKVTDPYLDDLSTLGRGERVHLLRGRLAYQAYRFVEAAREFEAAVAAAPDSPRARINLATALGQLGKLDEAEAQLRRALVLDPESGTAHFNLGSLELAARNYGEAIEHLQSAVRIEPGDFAAHLALAQALRSVARPAESLAQYRHAIEIDPLSEEARFGEAALLVELGAYRQARERLEEAHELLPEAGRIAHGLAKLLAAGPDPALRDGARALDLALRVYAASPTIAHAVTVAQAQAESGNCSAAAEWQRRALSSAQAGGSTANFDELGSALERYEHGTPCRAPSSP